VQIYATRDIMRITDVTVIEQKTIENKDIFHIISEFRLNKKLNIYQQSKEDYKVESEYKSLILIIHHLYATFVSLLSSYK